MNYEWDPVKNLANRRKHGFSLEEATIAFQDEHRIEELDDREYDEERWILTGRVHRILAVVVYAERHGVIRIISARKAEPDEEWRYRSGRHHL